MEEISSLWPQGLNDIYLDWTWYDNNPYCMQNWSDDSNNCMISTPDNKCGRIVIQCGGNSGFIKDALG